MRVAWWIALGLMFVLAGCSQAGATNTAYGGALNHVHDLLALRGMPQTVLLATHIGLYRTTDAGHAWVEVAGGSGQAMDGLMLFKLAQSPVDPQRVYVLAIPRTDRPQDAKATPGLYTSADAGKTWRLASAESALPTKSIFTIGAGSASAGQVYTLIPALAQNGLYASDDSGAHWHALPPLPDAHPTGVMGDPNHAGRILLWSASTGLYSSDDQGHTWHAAAGTQNGIFSVSLAGTTIYASGSDGTFLSTNDGANYTLVNKDFTFSTVVVCASATTHAYALAGTAVYASADGGHTWTQTAATTSHPGNLTVDPANAGTAYVGFSYPVGVETTTNAGARWTSVLP
ncbi:MAG TPA: sialidase family protein [Ktedonobacterales bacterium]|jgi:photosystem II stability/assembly factor-like uncharacterized protein|nr:sialidase family protein [Ktedonobacterales bacterium]